ncbi:MAG: folylpolyglutamate synthase/dihydrofolate synthase family protein [Bdellovibrionales bacterium]
MYQSDLKHNNKTLEEKLHALYTLSGKKNLNLDLFRDTYIQLLEAFDNPHHRLPPVIHVAGTNGKGSIIATLKSIYEAQGYKVHTYTSPHLIRFNERIVLAGQQIDNQSLEALIDETLKLNNDRDATFFEAATAMAFAAFTRVPADICLLEVGLGGRLDCTNIIEKPAATIISTIGMDHIDYLGDTIEKIAAEKAGIMKTGAPCIIGHQNDTKTFKIFEDKANTIGTTLIHKENLLPNDVTPALPGPHQTKNINAALTAIKALQNQFPVKDEAIKKGITSINWPARLQKLPSEAFGFNDKTTIWLDGGHNEDAGKAIKNHLQSLSKKGDIAAIFCMMKHKHPKGFISQFADHCTTVLTTQIPNEPASLSSEDLSKAISPIASKPTNTYQDALNQLKNNPPANILITGSLYLAGHILHDLENSGHN